MGKENWLRVLHVRHAGHWHSYVCFGLLQQRAQERGQSALDFGSGIDDEKTKVGGDEFVAAAAGVEFPAERAELFNQGFFYEVVDVFGGSAEGVDPSGVVLRAGGNFIERG